MNRELEQYAIDILEEVCLKFPMGYMPILEWRRMPVTAGLAIYHHRTIALSTILMIDKERVRETLLHEYAHLLAFARKGRKGTGHGAAWKQAMIDVGLTPTVRHKFEVKRNQARQEVVYRCEKCKADIIRKRRLPARRRYFHLRCGGKISFLVVRAVTPSQNSA